jgi:hypothetical protein
MLVLYDRYTEASGLNIHVWKSTYYIFNCSPDPYEELQSKGISTPETEILFLYLGLEPASNMNTTLRETFQKIDLKAIKRYILATTPPTNILHSAALIISAMTP